jgi:hypothetical protein
MQFIHWRKKNSPRSNLKMNSAKTVSTRSTSLKTLKKDQDKFSESENTIILFFSPDVSRKVSLLFREN